MLISHFHLLDTRLPSSKHEQHIKKGNQPQGGLGAGIPTHKHHQYSHNDHLIQSRANAKVIDLHKLHNY
jgi:hypothetical protein